MADGRMPSMRIVPPFNILEDGQFGLSVITKASLVNPLTLKGSKEALTHRIAIAVPNVGKKTDLFGQLGIDTGPNRDWTMTTRIIPSGGDTQHTA